LSAERFIAGRILSPDKNNFSHPIVRIAIVSIALGMTVMLVSISILTGFQKQIREKVIGFGAHIEITRFDENSSFEPRPVSIKQPFYPSLEKVRGIRHIQVYANKAGIIKTKDQIQGVVLKGIGKDYDWSFFKDKIIAGTCFHLPDTGKTNDILISKSIASLLKLEVNQDIRMYFISGSQTLGRKFHISGIFETGLEELDRMYVIGDLRHIQKLNSWTTDQVGGFEVFLDDFKDLDRFEKYIYRTIGFSLDAVTIRQLYPQIFDWLDLQDINVLIILILMVLVAGITMISTLLILILERTNMIGILKALGMRNRNIRMIFLYNAVYIIASGLFWGNLAGIALCLIQLKSGIITLPQESYYVSVVPVNLNILNIFVLNAGTLMVCLMMLLLPSYIITRVSPVKAIRFD
jgi:lipoprotein-releasing system permease protein